MCSVGRMDKVRALKHRSIGAAPTKAFDHIKELPIKLGV